MAVRSNYIKKFIDTKKSLDKEFQEVVTESMKNIIGDNAKDEMRKLLKEAEEDQDSYTEEEVTDDTNITDEEGTTEETDDVTVDDSDVATDDDVDIEDDITGDVVDVEGAEVDGETEDDTVDDDIWNELEGCKSADGEYDCRGMEDGNLLKVLKAMGPEDGVRVMSNGDGTVAVEVDGDAIQGTAEFVIELDDEGGVEAVEEGRLHESDNTGYTTNYQKDSAMTVSSNKETANPKTTYSMDDGVPTGTERPYGKPDKKATPYGNAVKNEVNEEALIEVELEEEELNEVMSSTENNPTVRGTGMTHANTNKKGKKFRNSSEGGVKVKGTGENSYSGSGDVSESLVKRLARVEEDNKVMKTLIPELNSKLQESLVINASMGYVIKLLNENTTTSEEKGDISRRFSKVNSLDEAKQLYHTINEELHRVNSDRNVAGLINSQLAEGKQGKQSLVETTVYRSEKVNEAIDFMKRLDKVQ